MEEELECPICGEIFRQVVETACCSRLYCRECVCEWITKSGTCPSCREKISPSQLRPNVPFQRLADNLPTTCPNSDSGCTDKLTRGCLVEHLSKCAYGTQECPQWSNCGMFLRKALAQHLQNDCPARPVPCKDCQTLLPLNNLEEHWNTVCPESEVSCTLCADRMKRIALAEHNDKFCPNVLISCSYERFGCTNRIARGTYKLHLEEAAELHLQLVHKALDAKEEEMEKLVLKLQKKNSDILELQMGLANLSVLKPELPFSLMRDEPVLLPSFLVKEASFGELVFDQENLRVTFNPGMFPQFGKLRALMVRGDAPVPRSRSVYYFEILIENRGKEGAIGLGFCPENHPWYGMPGWTGSSFGYHGDDGRIFSEKAGQYGMPFGPEYGKGDIIGCGMHQDSGRIFFTKNGSFLGFAFQEAEQKTVYYPVIGLHSNGAKVSVNFGQRPFKYSLDKLREWSFPREGEQAGNEGGKEKEKEGAASVLFTSILKN